MSAIHVVVRPSPAPALEGSASALSGLLDLVVDGINVTARLSDGQALPLLSELGHAVASLTSGRRRRATLQSYARDEVWELGLEVDGADVLITVYRAAPSAEVAVFERRVPLSALEAALSSAIDEALEADGAPVATLVAAKKALADAPRVAAASASERTAVEIAPRALGGIGFWARAELRRHPTASDVDPQLERADLHALLARGEAGVRVRGRTKSFGATHLFLLAERLLALADDVVEAWQSGRPTFRRVELAGVRIGVQRGADDAPLALVISGHGVERVTFPKIDPPAFAAAAARFARALADALCDSDPEQRANLRLGALLDAAATVLDRSESSEGEETRTNALPDSYRSFSSCVPRRADESRGPWEHGGRMRFVPRWVATVPGIDLRATFLCGDRLIVGAERETACIQRGTGRLLWRAPTLRAAAVATPAGLARLHPDGALMLHDLDSGEVRFSTRLAPRTGGGASGAVVHTPGLPKLLVVAEGDRRITALDLVSGEVRWRHTARRPGVFRMRRAGKLLLVTGGDTLLSALDVVTGECVWRRRARQPFNGDIAVDHDSVFAVTTTTSGGRLMHLDPWTGETRWEAEIDERPTPGQPPLLTPDAVVVPVRDRRGSGLEAFCRETGSARFKHGPGLTAPTVAWLTVDAGVVGNSSAGTLLCIDARDGAVRYSHVFPRHVDADQPRRLEPVLRSGALFVPQHQVHVVRPRDGEVLGTVPSDLIPDLLRVDERCDVYVAEDSGHVAAFGAAARLTLVKA